MLLKDDAEHPVPAAWRLTFGRIANALAAGDFELRSHPIAGVKPVDLDTAESISNNMSAYGESLAALHEETWTRSIYRWMDGHWEVLVDLTTSSEAVSDLALHAKIYEEGDGFALEVFGVYVP